MKLEISNMKLTKFELLKLSRSGDISVRIWQNIRIFPQSKEKSHTRSFQLTWNKNMVPLSESPTYPGSYLSEVFLMKFDKEVQGTYNICPTYPRSHLSRVYCIILKLFICYISRCPTKPSKYCWGQQRVPPSWLVNWSLFNVYYFCFGLLVSRATWFCAYADVRRKNSGKPRFFN